MLKIRTLTSTWSWLAPRLLRGSAHRASREAASAQQEFGTDRKCFQWSQSGPEQPSCWAAGPRLRLTSGKQLASRVSSCSPLFKKTFKRHHFSSVNNVKWPVPSELAGLVH